jgi:aminoglycoside 2''-phosphotransferase
MATSEFYIHQIEKRYPELAIKTAMLNQAGQYNDVLVINDALIFRFAKVPAAIDTCRQERVILQSLQGALPLSIPNPSYHSLETYVIGEAFLGYPLIPGKPLIPFDLKTITAQKIRQKLADQIANFLQALHLVAIDKVIPIDLPSYESEAEQKTQFEKIKSKLFESMRPDARRKVEKHYKDYFNNPQAYSFKPVLRHGDFGTGNILWERQRTSLTGILDFGSCGAGDPAVDFAGVLASFGEEFYRLCSATYPEMDQAIDRAKFYQGTFALEEALFGFENDDKAAYENGMALYI